MPQLDIATFPPQLIWLAITFLILYGLMAWLALPRVGGIIAARRTRIDGDLEKANAMKAETDAVIAAYERALAQARQQAMATLKETTDRLNAQATERQRTLAAQRRQIETDDVLDPAPAQRVNPVRDRGDGPSRHRPTEPARSDRGIRSPAATAC